jgi:sirohydrochlorin cobaltochelatase
MILILVTHGSRDPRHQISLENLAENLGQKIANHYIIKTATLECNQLIFSEQIVKIALENHHLDLKLITILPLFLLSGVHVTLDIPEQIKLAQQQLTSNWKITLKPHLGSYLNLQNILEKQFQKGLGQARIILAHGSSLKDSNKTLATIALNLNAVTAYWSVDPSLETQVKNLVNFGYSQITIIPYFLFSGKITDIITEQIISFRHQFPLVKFEIGKPLNESPELIQFIRDEMLKN